MTGLTLSRAVWKWSSALHTNVVTYLFSTQIQEILMDDDFFLNCLYQSKFFTLILMWFCSLVHILTGRFPTPIYSLTAVNFRKLASLELFRSHKKGKDHNHTSFTFQKIFENLVLIFTDFEYERSSRPPARRVWVYQKVEKILTVVADSRKF